MEAKPKRQLTQAQLDQLAKAREKANAVRKRNAETKKKEKKLKELQRQVQEEELDDHIKRYEKPDHGDDEPIEVPRKPAPKPKPKPKPRPKKPKPGGICGARPVLKLSWCAFFLFWGR